MRAARGVAVLGVTLAALLAVPAAVPAGSPGQWERITSLELRNIDEVTTHRTGDGRLHVLWVRRDEPRDVTLLDQVMGPAGAKVASNVVAGSWIGINDPKVVPDGSGMRVFFGGFHTGERDDPNDNLNTLTGPSAGTPWTLHEGTVVDNDQAYAAEVGATVALDGTPFQSWTVTGGTFVHRGLDPATPNHNFQGQVGGCCGASSDMATDQDTGRIWLAWHSGVRENPGLFVNEVNAATGAPVGAARLMPGTVTDNAAGDPSSIYLHARTPITSRPGRAGVFVAYPGGYPVPKRVLVWRIGSGRSTVVARRDRNHDDVGIAADSKGRVWVLWTEPVNRVPRIYARRSNPSVTQWGATVAIRPPAGTSTVWKMVGNAQDTKLDVIATATTSAGLAGWHTQMRPGLSLSATPRRFQGREVVTFRVTDAGVPVPGAKVSAAGDSGQTNSNGVVAFAVGPFDRDRDVVARATKAGFVARAVVLRVRAPD